MKRFKLLNLLLIAVGLLAHVQASDSVPLESVGISAEQTCYQGEWGSMEAYLDRPVTLKLYENPVQRERAVQRYEFWRSNFDCRWFTYRVDGLDVQGFLVSPVGDPPTGGWPVVIFNHGGNADIGEIRFQYIAARLFPLVDEGFVVIGSQYRGTRIGDVENPDRLRDEFGGADVNDVRALLPIIRSLPYADSDRVGLWGISRGGMMNFLVARNSKEFKTMIVESTPTDMFKAIEHRPDMENVLRTWVPEYDRNKEAALKARSVVYWIDDLDPDMSMLILHGSEDGRVSALNALALAEGLQQRDRPYKLVIFENDGHGLRGHFAETTEQILAWLKQELVAPAPQDFAGDVVEK